MIHLDLSEEETRTLMDMIENCLEDLHTEIVHTDNLEYKHSLKERKTVLKKLDQVLADYLQGMPMAE
jgi:hypothetical protein